MEDPTKDNTIYEDIIIAKLENVVCKNLVNNRIGKTLLI
jgi:hypothetical protein